jgi:exodeoxyribonuclease-3
MKLLSWNVNGIRACIRNGFVDFLKKEKPDLLGLQEIKIDHASRLKEELDFGGYEEAWNPAQRPGYSGTAILSKTKPVSSREGIGKAEYDDEGRVITAEMPKFYFVNVYFPNSKPDLARLDYKQLFNKAIIDYIKKLEKKKPVIICGDFNVAREEIDLARPAENHFTAGFTDEERLWGRKFLEAGFVDTFRELNGDKIQYSWWSYRAGARARNVGWRIDYFLVSSKISKHVKKAFILDKVHGSDHCPVGIELDI